MNQTEPVQLDERDRARLRSGHSVDADWDGRLRITDAELD